MKKQLYIAYGSNLNKEQMQYRCPGSSVPVAVWKISADDEKSLDLYEGFPCTYSKQRLHVNFSDGTGCSAMAYVMNGGYLAPPSASYFDIVAQGFRDCGLDERVLQQALMESRGKITHLERRG